MLAWCWCFANRIQSLCEAVFSLPLSQCLFLIGRNGFSIKVYTMSTQLIKWCPLWATKLSRKAGLVRHTKIAPDYSLKVFCLLSAISFCFSWKQMNVLLAQWNKINEVLHARAVMQGNPTARKEAGRGVGEILKVWSHLPALLERPVT